MRGLDWSIEQTLCFIKLYEKFPVLWDNKHPEHKNRLILCEAWLDLQREFDESIPLVELKKKKESLMSSYRPLKKKVLDSESGAKKSEEVFKPSWFAYEAMDKFLGFKHDKKYSGNSEDGWDREAEAVYKYNSRTSRDNNSVTGSDNMAIKNDDVNSFLIPKEISELKKRNLYKKRKNFSSQSDMLIANSLKEAAKAMKTLSSRECQQQDQCSIFGQLIASQLRQLSPKNRVKAQVRLSGVIGEVLLEELEQQSPAPASSIASGSSDYNSSN